MARNGGINFYFTLEITFMPTQAFSKEQDLYKERETWVSGRIDRAKRVALTNSTDLTQRGDPRTSPGIVRNHRHIIISRGFPVEGPFRRRNSRRLEFVGRQGQGLADRRSDARFGGFARNGG